MITRLMGELAGEYCRQYSINLPLWFRIQLFRSYPSLTMTLHICIAIWCMQSALRTQAPLLFYLLFHSDGAKIDSHIDIAPSDKNLADHRGNREWPKLNLDTKKLSTRLFVSLILT